MSFDDYHLEFVRADSEPAFAPEAIRHWPNTLTEGLAVQPHLHIVSPRTCVQKLVLRPCALAISALNVA